MEQAASLFAPGQFLGGHPMAGRERRGVEAAEADLFRGRPYVLTPRPQTQLENPAGREFETWIRKIGAVPIILDAARARPHRSLHFPSAAARVHGSSRVAGAPRGTKVGCLRPGSSRQHPARRSARSTSGVISWPPIEDPSWKPFGTTSRNWRNSVTILSSPQSSVSSSRPPSLRTHCAILARRNTS